MVGILLTKLRHSYWFTKRQCYVPGRILRLAEPREEGPETVVVHLTLLKR